MCQSETPMQLADQEGVSLALNNVDSFLLP